MHFSQRASRVCVALLLLYGALVQTAAAAAAVRLTRIALTVSNLQRSEAFYRDGLGFKRVAEETSDDPAIAQLYGVPKIHVHALVMKLGDEEVEFDQFTPRGKSYPTNSRSPDRWFQHFAIVVSDMPRAYAQLRHVRFKSISSHGPRTLPAETGGVQAFKFRDPDGHPLELIYFPAGQGRAVWHQAEKANDLFEGIDHSAIGIANTASSLAFYTELLGLKKTYASLNQGPTQQALDGTFNATVRITGLHSASDDGPGVELLDYRAPPDGRAASVETHSNDLVSTRLTFKVDDLDALSKALLDADVPFVSPPVVPLPNGAGRALIVRDPDGHVIELVQ